MMELLLASTVVLAPGTVMLGWDANSEAYLAGYRVYWGTASRVYTNDPRPTVPVSSDPVYTVTGLTPGVKYYFAVTAYSTTGLESGYSNEVSATLPLPPTGLEITSQSASLRWFGVVLLATTNEKASATFRYRELKEGTQYSTIIATPEPTKTEHRVVLYLTMGTVAYYTYNWTMTNAEGTEVSGTGTFQTR